MKFYLQKERKNEMPRKSIFGENAQLTTMRLYSWEREMVKELLEKEREKRKNKIKKDRSKK